MPRSTRGKQKLSAMLSARAGQLGGSHGDGKEPPKRAPDEKKHKQLAYQRRSVACTYCRRRKIRCEEPDEASDRCVACIRQNKEECNYTPVEHPITPGRAAARPRRVEPTARDRQNLSASASFSAPINGHGSFETFAHPPPLYSARPNGHASPQEGFSRAESFTPFPPSAVDSHLPNSRSPGLGNAAQNSYPAFYTVQGPPPVYSGPQEHHFNPIYPPSYPGTAPLAPYPQPSIDPMQNAGYAVSQDEIRWGGLARSVTYADPESSRRMYSPPPYHPLHAAPRRASTMSAIVHQPPSLSGGDNSSATNSSRSPHLPGSAAEMAQPLFHHQNGVTWNPYPQQDHQQQRRRPAHENHEHEPQWY